MIATLLSWLGHFGRIWERRISCVRHVTEEALLQLGKRGLTRVDFATLLQESATVVNNTPLWAVSSNHDDLLPLSPARLLTLRKQPNAASRDTFTESNLDYMVFVGTGEYSI